MKAQRHLLPVRLLTSGDHPFLNSVKIRSMNDTLMPRHGAGLACCLEPLNA